MLSRGAAFGSPAGLAPASRPAAEERSTLRFPPKSRRRPPQRCRQSGFSIIFATKNPRQNSRLRCDYDFRHPSKCLARRLLSDHRIQAQSRWGQQVVQIVDGPNFLQPRLRYDAGGDGEWDSAIGGVRNGAVVPRTHILVADSSCHERAGAGTTCGDALTACRTNAGAGQACDAALGACGENVGVGTACGTLAGLCGLKGTIVNACGVDVNGCGVKSTIGWICGADAAVCAVKFGTPGVCGAATSACGAKIWTGRACAADAGACAADGEVVACAARADACAADGGVEACGVDAEVCGVDGGTEACGVDVGVCGTNAGGFCAIDAAVGDPFSACLINIIPGLPSC